MSELRLSELSLFLSQIMQTITNTKTSNSKIKIEIASISIKRNTTNGCTLKIKSPLFADFFADKSDYDLRKTVSIGGVKVSSIVKKDVVDEENNHYGNFYDMSHTLFNGSRIVNLSFLREKRIGSGVEFSIIGRFSQEALEHFKECFKTEVSKFYMENMREVNINCEINVLEDAAIVESRRLATSSNTSSIRSTIGGVNPDLHTSGGVVLNA